MSESDKVCAALEAMGIAFERHRHRAIYHMDECVESITGDDIVFCKNFFLTTKSKKIFCLCIAAPEARLHTSDLSHQAGTPRLSFADEAAMMTYLHVYPGAVSPLGLIFDTENRVRLLADQTLRSAARLAFHPCDNTETVVLSAQDFFEKFLPGCGHEVTYAEMD